MLPNGYLSINTYYLTVRESLLDYLHRLLVKFWLIVCRNKYRAIDNQEVGVCGWKSVTIVIHRLWHRQRQQTVRLALFCAKNLQLLFEGIEVLELLILVVIAFHVKDSVIRRNSYYSVYMTVGIISDEVAIIEPHYAFCAENLLQIVFYAFF